MGCQLCTLPATPLWLLLPPSRLATYRQLFLAAAARNGRCQAPVAVAAEIRARQRSQCACVRVCVQRACVLWPSLMTASWAASCARCFLLLLNMLILRASRCIKSKTSGPRSSMAVTWQPGCCCSLFYVIAN